MAAHDINHPDPLCVNLALPVFDRYLSCTRNCGLPVLFPCAFKSGEVSFYFLFTAEYRSTQGNRRAGPLPFTHSPHTVFSADKWPMSTLTKTALPYGV